MKIDKSARPVLAAVIAAGALFGLARGASAADVTILFNCYEPPQFFNCVAGLPEMRKRIEAATEGRVTLNIPPSSLAPTPQQYQAVTSGVMDGAFSNVAFLGDHALGMQLPTLPFVGHDDPVASAVAMWDTYQKFFADKPGQFDKVVLLSVSSLPGSDIWSTTDAPIDSVAELARRKMWAPPGPPANLLKGAGAAVVAGPAVQMLELITNGVVDGFAAIDRGNVDQLKLSGYVKSATHFDRTIALGTFAFFVSKTKWDTISSADQKAIREALGRDYAAWVSMEPRRLYLAALKRQTEAGIRTVDAGPEFTAAMKKIGQADVDRWKAQVAGMGVDADAVMAFYDQAYDQALKDYPVEP